MEKISYRLNILTSSLIRNFTGFLNIYVTICWAPKNSSYFFLPGIWTNYEIRLYFFKSNISWIIRLFGIPRITSMRRTSQLLKYTGTYIPDKGQTVEWISVFGQVFLLIMNHRIRLPCSHSQDWPRAGIPPQGCHSPGKTCALRSRYRPYLTGNLLLRVGCRQKRLGHTCPFLLSISAI